MKISDHEGEGLRWVGLLAMVFGFVAFCLAAGANASEGALLTCLAFILWGYMVRCAARALFILGVIAKSTQKPAVEVTPFIPHYLYEVAGDVRGPVPLPHLLAMRALPADRRTVSGETLICLDGKIDWMPLKVVAMAVG